MSKQFFSPMLAVILLLSPVIPSFSEDSQTASSAQIAQSTQSKSSNRDFGKLPAAAASFVAGSLVGMPVSVVRYSADEMGRASRAIRHGLKDPLTAPFYLLLAPEALLFAGASGVVMGPTAAIGRSAKNCWDKPFSKDAFSLGATEEWEY